MSFIAQRLRFATKATSKGKRRFCAHSRQEMMEPRAARPGVVLYDGTCVFCTGIARFVAAHARAERYTLVGLESSEAPQLLAATGGMPTGDTFVLLDYGRRFERSDAALHLALGLRWPYPLAFALILIPRVWRDDVYAFIARNRTLLGGG